MKYTTALFLALLLPMSFALQAQGFNDEFDGPALDPRWTWLRERASSWMLWSGMLEITTERGALNGTSFNNVRNMLLQAAPAETFWCETRVHFRPKYVFHNAGILYYVDDDNYIRVSRGILENHNGLWMEYEVDGQTGFLHVDDVTEDVVTLRLSRYNDTQFTASYSLDGAHWYLIAQKTLPLERSGSIGIQAANGDGLGARGDDRPAQFEYFRVNITTGTGVTPEAGQDALRVLEQFPNPVKAGQQGGITIQLDQPSTVRMTLVDLLGRVHWRGGQMQLPPGRHALHFSSAGLTPGVYLLYITTGSRHVSRRMTIVK